MLCVCGVWWWWKEKRRKEELRNSIIETLKEMGLSEESSKAVIKKYYITLV